MKDGREARIRDEVRRQIAEDESRRRNLEAERLKSEDVFHEEQLRQRIIQEETRAYFENSPDYVEFINESGDSEWLTRKQIQAREGYFDYEEHVENPDKGRRAASLRIAAYILSLILLAAGTMIYMLEDVSTVHVLCNVPGAEILVDGQRSDLRTDARLELPAGEHLLEVRFLGYMPVGEPYQVIQLEEGERKEVSFILQAAP